MALLNLGHTIAHAEETITKMVNGTPIESILEKSKKQYLQLLKDGKTEEEAKKIIMGTINGELDELTKKAANEASAKVLEALKKKGVTLTNEEVEKLIVKVTKAARPKPGVVSTIWKVTTGTVKTGKSVITIGAIGAGGYYVYQGSMWVKAKFDELTGKGDSNAVSEEKITVDGKEYDPGTQFKKMLEDAKTPEGAETVWNKMKPQDQNAMAVDYPELFAKLPLMVRFKHRLLRGRDVGGWPIENIALATAAAYGLWKARKYLWTRTKEFMNWAKSGDSLAKCTFTADGKDYIADFDMKQKAWKLRYQGTTVTKESSGPSKEEVKDFF